MCLEAQNVALLAAVQSVPVDTYISLEGAGFPAADILRTQLKPQLQPHPELAAKAEAIITSLSAGKTVAGADVPQQLMVLFRPSVQPYLISWFKYDPRVEIAKVKGLSRSCRARTTHRFPLRTATLLRRRIRVRRSC